MFHPPFRHIVFFISENIFRVCLFNPLIVNRTARSEFKLRKIPKTVKRALNVAKTSEYSSCQRHIHAGSMCVANQI